LPCEPTALAITEAAATAAAPWRILEVVFELFGEAVLLVAGASLDGGG